MGRAARLAIHPREPGVSPGVGPPQPGLPERAPFPIRLQIATDVGALRWGMLAWENPWAAFPLAPFWASAGVVAGLVTRDTPPMMQLTAEGRATLSGSVSPTAR